MHGYMMTILLSKSTILKPFKNQSSLLHSRFAVKKATMVLTVLSAPSVTAVDSCAQGMANARDRGLAKATASAAATGATRASCVTAVLKATSSRTRIKKSCCVPPVIPAAKGTAVGPGLRPARPASLVT